jgi:hypothetical protein
VSGISLQKTTPAPYSTVGSEKAWDKPESHECSLPVSVTEMPVPAWTALLNLTTAEKEN